MKSQFRALLISIARVFEIFLSVLALVAVLIYSYNVLRLMYQVACDYISLGSTSIDFSVVLSAIIALIIAVEFVKMLAKQTPASAVEVVLFVIAKSIILEHDSALNMLLGVVAIAILFAVRKFLFNSGSSLEDGYLFRADTLVEDVCKMCRVSIPKNLGNTLKEVVEQEFARLGKTVKEREKLVLEDVSIMIYSMRDGEIDTIEVWNRKKNG